MKIAQEREQAAKKVTEMGVWREVVKNVIEMDCAEQDKISILLQAVPDLGIIMSQLSLYRSKGVLEDKDYKNILQFCLLDVNGDKSQVHLNPRGMVGWNTP